MFKFNLLIMNFKLAKHTYTPQTNLLIGTYPSVVEGRCWYYNKHGRQTWEEPLYSLTRGILTWSRKTMVTSVLITSHSQTNSAIQIDDSERTGTTAHRGRTTRLQRFGNYQKFKDALSYLPRFKIREGGLQKINEEFKQKKVDIMLAVDAVKLASTGKIDRAIFVTGDSDFVPVIESIDGTGVTTTLCYYPNQPIHNSIRSAVDERFELNKDFLNNHRR